MVPHRRAGAAPVEGVGGVNCNQGNLCTFEQIKERLAQADVLSVGVGKGRDFAFQGAVDALRLGDKVYDSRRAASSSTTSPNQ